jgi:N-methylhydantoinase B
VPRAKDVVAIPRGTIFHQWAGGGGGYGDPRERPRDVVRAEVRDGLVSPRVAQDVYGLRDAASSE